MSVSQRMALNATSSNLNFVDGDQYIFNISRPSPSTFSSARFCGAIVDLHLSWTVDESIEKAPIWNDLKLPPRLSVIFTGRRDALERLDNFFVPSETSVGLGKQRVFVLYGLGGVGKSQICLKFVEEHSDRWVHGIFYFILGSLLNFDVISFWRIYYVDASTLETIESSLQDIARDSGTGNKVQDALRWLSQQRKEWLLLFDNADDPNVNLRKVLPPCNHGNVIITTRNEACRLHAPDSNHHVSGMDPDEAVNLLLTSSMVEPSQENRSLAFIIVKELGYLALAIAQVGAYISRSCSLTEYLSIYNENRAEVLRKHPGQTADDYEWTVYTTWEISFKKLTTAAATFLQLCGFLHYNGISKAIFQKASSTRNRGDVFSNARIFLRMFQGTDGSWSDFRFREVINELTSYSLINVGARNNEYSIHQLVHSWARDRTSVTEGQETRNCVMQILALSIEFNYRTEDFAFRRILVPHIDGLLADDIEAELAERFGQVYNENGRWNTAEKLQLRVMEERTKALGKDHLDTLCGMSNLAITYRNQGRLKEAELLDVRVVEARKSALGEDHPHTLGSMSNLAITYRKQDRLEEAEQLYVQVVGARKRVLGEDHLDTLTSMNNLANTYWDQGRWKEAEQLHVQVIGARKRTLGEDHPHTLASMSNLAITYSDQGRWKEAEQLYVQVIGARKRVLGEDHPDTLDSMYNLAITFSDQGWWKEAEELEVQVVGASKRVLGEDHPDTLASMNDLAITYSEQGRWKEAEQLGVQVVGARKRVLGEDHPDTLASMNNLAITYRNQGRLTEAEYLEAWPGGSNNYRGEEGVEQSRLSD
jgi:tetratricopeptide (TPR) repeat protein